MAAKTKAPPPGRGPKYSDNAVIRLNKDEEGRKYGPDNNPKRSKAAPRFALYKDGMTIGEYKKAVGDAVKAYTDILWDSKEDVGFITIKEAA